MKGGIDMGSDKILSLADKLKKLRDRKAELEDDLKALTAEIDETDKALSDQMMEAELPKFSHSGVTFYLKTRLFASPQAGRKEDMFDALREHGYGDLITETVNSNTLSSFCKEQIEQSGEAEALPEWLSQVVSTYEKTSVGVRKS